MSQFERELPPFRLVETHHGDDLQRIASREMGDANRWPELVWLNSLIHPYLTDDASAASARVLLTGSLLRVPAASGTPVDEPERAQVFGRDCGLWGKRLAASESGDFAVVTGTKNLVQQLRHAIITPRGQLTRHAGYGCLVWNLHGAVQGPTAELLGAQYVKATLEADYRVRAITSSTAVTDGDSLRITAQAEAIDGGSVDVTSDMPEPPPGDPSSDEMFAMTTGLLHEFVHFTLPSRLGI